MHARLIAMALSTAALSAEAAGPAITREWLEAAAALPAEKRAKVRALTKGPKSHWFGYYDRFQFDATGRYVLGMQVDFDHRSPRGDDVIKIGMIDLQDGDRWIELGESRAWGWQQGCHLQWRPGHDDEVLWSDREDGRFVCRVLNVKTGAKRTLPFPVDSLSPDGKYGLGVDFARIANHRPGYGYAGVPDPHKDVAAPADSGVYRVDLDTGAFKMLVTCEQVARLPSPKIKPGDKHYINHIQWSPDGRRFLFFHRGGAGGMGFTRAFTASAEDGSDVRLLDTNSSHYQWRDPEHVLIWNNGYRLYADDGSGKGTLLWQAPNGHQTYLPDPRWIITDTYPEGARRMQTLYLVYLPTMKFIPLGSFHSPAAFRNEWRCDTHPRISRDGRWVCFDATHDGTRQMYLMEIGPLLKAE